MDIVQIHNNNIHTVTKYKPLDLINNSDTEIYKNVINNINNKYKIINDSENDLKIGDHVFIKKICIKSGKRIESKKLNIRDNKVLASVTNVYSSGIYSIKLEENIGKFEEGKELIANAKDSLKLSEEEYGILIDEKRTFEIKKSHSNRKKKYPVESNIKKTSKSKVKNKYRKNKF